MPDCRSCRMPRPSSRCCRRGYEDYNEVHPHSGLKFLSPREFLLFYTVVSQVAATSPAHAAASAYVHHLRGALAIK
jgi:hypothetical protein